MNKLYLPLAAIVIGGIVFMNKKQTTGGGGLTSGGGLTLPPGIDVNEAENQEISYVEMKAPTMATAGKPFDVIVRVNNYNAWQTQHTVSLSGDYTAAKTVMLAGENLNDVTFSVTFASAGVYTIASGDLSATISVKAATAPPSSGNNQQVNGYEVTYTPTSASGINSTGYYEESYTATQAVFIQGGGHFSGGGSYTYPAGTDDYNRIKASVDRQYAAALSRYGIGIYTSKVGVKITVVG